MKTSFIKGFAQALGVSVDEAREKWADFTRAVPANEKKKLENSDWATGYMQGCAYNLWDKQEH